MQELKKVRRNIDIFNEYLKDKNQNKAAECLLEIYIETQQNFKKTLLIGGALPEPSAFDLKEKIYVFEYFKKSCEIVINQLIDNEQMRHDFSQQINVIVKAYEIIVNHNTSNDKRCNQCEFLHYNKDRQLQMVCVFIEDQMRLAHSNNEKKIGRNGIYTGIESMTPLITDGNEQYKLSSSDVIESDMELADELFKFIFYINRKNIKEAIENPSLDCYPYEVPSFEEILHLTNHRVMVKRAWDLFKYRDWTLKLHKYNNENRYSFEPQNYKEFKREVASIQRTEYDEFQKSMKTTALWKIFNDNLKTVLKKIHFVELENVFDISDEYIKELMNFYGSIVKSNMQFAFKFYSDNLLNVEIEDGISFKYVFDTINYLYSMASIYMEKAHKKVNLHNKNDYYKLAPIISKDKLIIKLTKILAIDEKKATKCIDIFIFKPQFKKNKILLDLFSQPLVYVSNKQIVFTPCFIMQMNVKRIVDKILGAIDYNFSEKGYNMEELINSMIGRSNYIKVNKSKIKFEAYDGKDVEFDSISIFENKLIIMEMKCRNAPYSPKEKNDKNIVLNEVVEQVKRRVNIVQHNWNEIKKRASIKLMENPPAEKDIIKIACFNFFDFTGKIIDDVYITDYSAITKYFNKPIDYVNLIKNNSIERIAGRNIWDGCKPTLDNLLQFLEMPSMLKGFYENMKFLYKSIIRIEESNEHISVLDCYLEKNPYKEYFKLAVGKRNENLSKKANNSNKRLKKIKKKKRKRIKKIRKAQHR